MIGKGKSNFVNISKERKQTKPEINFHQSIIFSLSEIHYINSKRVAFWRMKVRRKVENICDFCNLNRRNCSCHGNRLRLEEFTTPPYLSGYF